MHATLLLVTSKRQCVSYHLTYNCPIHITKRLWHKLWWFHICTPDTFKRFFTLLNANWPNQWPVRFLNINCGYYVAKGHFIILAGIDKKKSKLKCCLLFLNKFNLCSLSTVRNSNNAFHAKTGLSRFNVSVVFVL